MSTNSTYTTPAGQVVTINSRKVVSHVVLVEETEELALAEADAAIALIAGYVARGSDCWTQAQVDERIAARAALVGRGVRWGEFNRCGRLDLAEKALVAQPNICAGQRRVIVAVD